MRQRQAGLVDWGSGVPVQAPFICQRTSELGVVVRISRSLFIALLRSGFPFNQLCTRRIRQKNNLQGRPPNVDLLMKLVQFGFHGRKGRQ
jgi:hypothetical protein